jgi:hypothetical protein
MKSYHSLDRIARAALATSTLLALGSGCTGQLPGSFRFAQQEEEFSANLEIRTKIDLLWVVDNSSSMDASQEKLRAGFALFAQKYMQPTWDIRVAVITTDTYLANPAFQTFLNTTIPGTTGAYSPYIKSRLGTFVNPSYAPNLVNLSTVDGTFDSGIKYKEMVPVWGSTWAQLLPGLHDGPIPGLCFEALPYFLNGVTQCAIRDDQSGNTGAANCLNPGAGETSITQCVNTVQNDTIRSGKAIVETMPPSGTAGDTAWTNALIETFTVNVTTGSVGHGSERGLGSVLQLISDNETTATAFFRPNSTRGIIFVSDEEDQTLEIEDTPAAGFNPWSHYACDQAGLVTANPTRNISGNNGQCCSNGTCRYGAEGTTCGSKTVDTHTFTVSFCPLTASLMPVSSVKTQLDDFFLALDGATGVAGATPNYFVVSIVALTGQAIQDLQATRALDDTAVGGISTVAVDRGDRYIELGNLVGNGSIALNIAASDYTAVLDSIGRALVEKEGTFTLTRAPTTTEEMIVKILHLDGSSTVITSDKFTIVDKQLTIHDINTILSFKSTDQISINYQPRTAF